MCDSVCCVQVCDFVATRLRGLLLRCNLFYGGLLGLGSRRLPFGLAYSPPTVRTPLSSALAALVNEMLGGNFGKK